MVLHSTWIMVVWLIFAALVITGVFGKGGDELLFSNKQDIRQFRFGYGNYTPVLGGLEYVRSLDYDFRENRLFFINLQNNEKTVIQSVHLMGIKKEPKVIVDTATQLENDLKSLVVDWLTKKIYFTDIIRRRVEVVNYDGSHRRVIVSTGLQQPDGIALYPQKGLMFVTDWGSEKKIERFNMDGSDRKIIYNKHVSWGRSITIDYVTSTIYWGDTNKNIIWSMDIDGSGLQKYNLSHAPTYITVSNTMVYWSNGASISAFVKANPRNSTVSVSKLKGSRISPNDIRVFGSYRQSDFSTPCAKNNGGCSHLCLLRMNGYTCACPTGVALQEDKKTCKDGMSKFLVFARRKSIRMVSLDVDKNIDFRLNVDRKHTKNVHGVTYDVERKRVYWADTSCTDKTVVNDIEDCTDHGSINSVYLNGSGFEHFVSEDIKAPDHIAIDWIARNIYWTDGVLSRIEVSRLDGSSRKIVVSDFLHKPRGLAIDPVEAKLYWSDWGDVAKIERSDLDGENREVLVEKEAVWPNGIALDLKGRKLYWADSKTWSISSYDLNTKKVGKIYDNANHPFGVSVLGKYVYWTDWFRKILRLRLGDVKGNEKVILDEITDVMGICAVDINIKYGTNPCHYKTTNCSHLCFAKPPKGTAICDCPSNMELGTDDKTCQIPSGYLVYSAGKEVMKTSFDTFKKRKRLPLSNTNHVTNFDVLYKTGRIVWFDQEGQGELTSVNTGYMNGSDFKVIMKVNLIEVDSLAIDWMSENVYMALTASNRIEVARIDGSFRKSLIFNEHILSPSRVMVNPHIRKLYWEHQKNDSTHALFQSNLDGSEIKELDKIHPLLCAIDYSTHKIYCVISLLFNLISYDPIIGKKEVLISYVPVWTRIVVFQQSIIYMDSQSGSIFKTSIKSLRDRSRPVTLMKTADLVDFKIYHKDMQTGENVCSTNNGGCHHFCFARTATKADCGCATHYTLSKDGKTCIEPQSFLIANQNNNFLRILFGDGVPDYVLPTINTKEVGPIAFDDIRDYIYWLQPGEKVVYRVLQNGKSGHGKINLLTDAQMKNAEKIEPFDIAIDPFSNTLFWTDKLKNTINFLNLYKGTRGVVFRKAGFYPRKIIAYPDSGKLFWTSVDEDKRKTILLSITFAGTDSNLLKSFDRSVLDDITIDHTSKLLYYLDTEKNKIVSMSLKGLNQIKYTIKPNYNPVSIATNDKDIFWADRNVIYKISKGASSSESSKFFHGRYDRMSQIISVNISRKKQNNPCFGDNGGCSHICRISYEVSLSSKENPSSAICGCPLNYHLDAANQKNCTVAEMCEIHQMYCTEDSKCISAELKCDGKKDCSDGQDESDPECNGLFPTPPCPPGYRRCGTTQKCILLSEWCDGNKDCPNSEDEVTCAICEENQFRCDGICVDISLKCNGETDCRDLVDEKGCPKPTSPIPVTNPVSDDGPQRSRMVAAIVSGVVVLLICIMFGILVYLKIRNSKKNSTNQPDGSSAWALQQLKSLSSSEDHTKSSVSTYISNDPSFYDRNNMTGQSEVCDSEFSQLILNPPPSPATAMSTISNSRSNAIYSDYEIPHCNHCHRRITSQETLDLVEGGGGGHDAPPPTVVSSTLLDEVDMYFPINWSQKSTICDDCQSTTASTQVNRQANGKLHSNGGVNNRHGRCSDIPRNNGHIRSICDTVSEMEPLATAWMYDNQDANFDRQYGEEPLFIDSNGHLIDPPPTPCTYLSEEDRPPSPAFSALHRRETYAPPPSPTSQLL